MPGSKRRAPTPVRRTPEDRAAEQWRARFRYAAVARPKTAQESGCSVPGLSPTSSIRSCTRRLRSAPDGDAVNLKRISDDGAHPSPGVQGTIRILKHHLHSPSIRDEVRHPTRWKYRDRRRSLCRTVRFSRRIMQRASVDLPQPVSPTRPSVSPRFTSKLTSSTARTCCSLPKRP